MWPLTCCCPVGFSIGIYWTPVGFHVLGSLTPTLMDLLFFLFHARSAVVLRPEGNVLFGQIKLETVAWTMEPDAWWELSLSEELFCSHKKCKRLWRLLFDVFGVVMTVSMNWSKKEKRKKQLLHWCFKKYLWKKSKTQTKYTFPMFWWVQCQVSNLSRSSKLCGKKEEMKKQKWFQCLFSK